MTEKTIKCDCCQKDSGIEASENVGTNGARVYRLGWIFKNLFLYTGKASDTYIACSKECAKKCRDEIFSRENVSPEKKEEVSSTSQKAKMKNPQMAEETANAVQRFADLLNKIPIKKEGNTKS